MRDSATSNDRIEKKAFYMPDSTAIWPQEGERIAKTLARAGVCSRRDAEKLIEDRRVSVNGKVLDTAAFKVTPRDVIKVDGKKIEAADRTRMWRYHKPRGLVTSHKDPQGRPTVFEKLKEQLPRVVSIGECARVDREHQERQPRGDVPGDPAEWPHYHCAPLASEEIYPVCAPSYLSRHAAPTRPEDLLAHALIHLEEPYRSATTWYDWFASLGIGERRVPKGLQVNDYVLAIQAVLEGQGVALGWRHLVEDMVKRGVLVRVTDYSQTTEKAFHVIWPKEVQLSRQAEAVREWLLAQAGPFA